MSGNLCRCTGYMGIVDAIERVMADFPSSPLRGEGRAPQTPGKLCHPLHGSRDARGALGSVQPGHGWPRTRSTIAPPGEADPSADERRESGADTRTAVPQCRAHPRHRRPARGGRRRNPHLPELRPPPPARCRLAAHVRRGGGGALHARALARRPAAGRQGRRPPGSQDRPHLRELRRRGHDPADAGRLPPGHRGPRRRPQERLARLGQRRLSPVRRLPARLAGTQPASMSPSATR